MGSWEAIKADPSLKLNEKLQGNGSNKLQWKRISTRGEYLLKVLKKQMELKLGVVRIIKKKKISYFKSKIFFSNFNLLFEYLNLYIIYIILTGLRPDPTSRFPFQGKS